MNSSIDFINSARQTIANEGNALQALSDSLDENFNHALQLLLQAQGRVVVCGIGKSALIARKIVATFNSTGTPAQFLHAAEAVHGDLGLVQPGEVVLCLSKSGNSPEIKTLVRELRSFHCPLIAITADSDSFLAREAQCVIHTPIVAEACPNNLAPTTSTTVQLVVGDAMAVALMQCRGFTAADFGKFHPGGSLGKKLFLKVKDVVDPNRRPEVQPDTPLKDIINEISSRRLGMTAVTEHGKVVGVITDGDIRRMLNTTDHLQGICARDLMSAQPKTIEADQLVQTALDQMEDFAITQLLVFDQGQYMGVLHLHDILKEGFVA